jgi:hypothetical protein
MNLARRCDYEKQCLAERAIGHAMREVEALGCSLLLTDAVVLLSQARDKVADFIDSQVSPASVDKEQKG